MVGPSLSDDERKRANTRLRLGFVLLVGASGGLIAFQSGASLPQIAVGVGGGLAVGLALLYLLLRWSAELFQHRRR